MDDRKRTKQNNNRDGKKETAGAPLFHASKTINLN